jgi:mannose-6-phosphate isomerase-like protein (cupin superfamily)
MVRIMGAVCPSRRAGFNRVGTTGAENRTTGIAIEYGPGGSDHAMNQRLTFSLGMATGVVLAGGIWVASHAVSTDVLAQAASAGPHKNTSKIVLENDRVRVKDATFYPDDPHPGMHTHDVPHVGVIIDGGTLKFNSPDGKTETMVLERGGAGYREAHVTHEPINTGKAPVRVIEVEIK